MTDEFQEDPGNEPRTDPDEDARIRALLADLGSGQAPEAASMPPEVSARLDETLAGLLAERAEAGESTRANVVPLRRRWVSRAAAAAAAVIVLGVGGVAVSNLGPGSDDQADSSAGGVAADSQAESQDSGTASGSADPEQPTNGLLSPDVPQLAAASFDTQVDRLVAAGEVAAPRTGLSESERTSAAERDLSADELSEEKQSDGGARNTAKGSCPGPETDDGSRHTTVAYDGSPAALVVHPPRDGKRLVEAWTCTGDTLLDSARIAAMPLDADSSGRSNPGDPGLGGPTPTP